MLSRSRRRRRRPGVLFTVALFVMIIAGIVWLDGLNPYALSGRPQIIDGDTLELDGERIRLAGIDAPEWDQICESADGDYACGRSARDALSQLARLGGVTCSVSGSDRYDRWLGICLAGAVEINAAMVSNGWAVDTGGYAAEENAARRVKRGLWAGRFETPSEFRQAKRRDVADDDAWVETVRNRLRGLGKRWWP